MALDEEAWAEIARLWVEGQEPVATIAGRFQISRQKIVAMARKCDWPQRQPAEGDAEASVAAERRDETAAESTGTTRAKTSSSKALGTKAQFAKTLSTKTLGTKTSSGKSGSAGGGDGRANVTTKPRRRSKGHQRQARRAMVERMFDAVDAKLRRLEHHMAEAMDETSADSERTARSLNSLIRSFEKLSAFEHKLDRPKRTRGASDDEGGRGDTTERRRQELARRLAKLLERR